MEGWFRSRRWVTTYTVLLVSTVVTGAAQAQDAPAEPPEADAVTEAETDAALEAETDAETDAALEAQTGAETDAALEAEPEPADAALEAEPEPADASPAASPSAEEGDAPILAYVLMASGTALILGGTATGMITLSKQSELDDACGYDGVCPTAREAEADEAQTLATVTDVLLGAGIVTLGVGLTLWLLQRDDSEEPAAVTASVGCGPTACGAAMEGRF